MKILWVVNTLPCDICNKIGMPATYSGGWIEGMASALSASKKLQLTIINFYGGKVCKSHIEGSVSYHAVPSIFNNEKIFKIVGVEEPDVIHVHGTEFGHGLELIKSFPNIKSIVSIQGLLSQIGKCYYAGLKFYEILQSISIRDIIRFDSLPQAKLKFIKRSKFESEYFRLASVIVGRTSWDEGYSHAAVSGLNYMNCGEILRGQFYDSKKWKLQECKKNTLFVSQAGYPIKGLHKLIIAVDFLKRAGINVCVRIAGPIPSTNPLTQDGYSKFILNRIEKLGLVKSIIFVGMLSADQMIREYINTHVFVLPSCVENSPNSLCEAQLLGVPVVASAVGGVLNLVNNNISGLLYPYDDAVLLAMQIKKIISDDEFACTLSRNEILAAEGRHDRNKIISEQLHIYKDVLSCS